MINMVVSFKQARNKNILVFSLLALLIAFVSFLAVPFVKAEAAVEFEVRYRNDHDTPNKASLNGGTSEDVRAAIEKKVNEVFEDINAKIEAGSKTAAELFAAGEIPFYSTRDGSDGKLSNDNMREHEHGALGHNWHEENTKVADAVILKNLNVGKEFYSDIIGFVSYNGITDEGVLVFGKFVEKFMGRANNDDNAAEYLGRAIADSFVVGNHAYQNFENGYVKVADVKDANGFKADGGGDVTVVMKKNVDSTKASDAIEQSENLLVANGNGAGSIGRTAEKGSNDWVNYWVKEQGVSASRLSKLFSEKYNEILESGTHPGYYTKLGIEDYYGDQAIKLYTTNRKDDSNSNLLMYNHKYNAVFFVKNDFKRGNINGDANIGVPVADEFMVDGKRYQNFTNGAVTNKSGSIVFEQGKFYNQNGEQAINTTKPAPINIEPRGFEHNGNEGNDYIVANGVSYSFAFKAYNDLLTSINDKIAQVISTAVDIDDVDDLLEEAYLSGEIPFYSTLAGSNGYITVSGNNDATNVREGLYSRVWEGGNVFRGAAVMINLNKGRSIVGQTGTIISYNYKSGEAVIVDTRLAPGFPLLKTENGVGSDDPDYVGAPVAAAQMVGNILIQNFEFGYIMLDTSKTDAEPELIRGRNFDFESDTDVVAHGNLTGLVGAVNLRTNAFDGEKEKNIELEDAIKISKAFSDKYDALTAAGVNIGFSPVMGIVGLWKHPESGSRFCGYGQIFYEGGSVASPEDGGKIHENMSIMIYNDVIGEAFLLTDEVAHWYQMTDEIKDTGLPMSEIFAFEGARYQVFTDKVLKITGERSGDQPLERKKLIDIEEFAPSYEAYFNSFENVGHKYTKASFDAFIAIKEEILEMGDDDNKIAFMSAAIAKLVLAPKQTGITLTSSLNVTYAGAEFTLAASGGQSNGAYSFVITAGGSGTGTISGNKLTVTKAGTINIIVVKVGDDFYADSESSVITMTVNKGTPTAPTIEIAEKTATSIKVKAIGGCEYSLDGETWQDSNEFTGLTANKGYKVYLRVKATDLYNASEAVSTDVTTAKKGCGSSIMLNEGSAVALVVIMIALAALCVVVFKKKEQINK